MFHFSVDFYFFELGFNFLFFTLFTLTKFTLKNMGRPTKVTVRKKKNRLLKTEDSNNNERDFLFLA